MSTHFYGPLSNPSDDCDHVEVAWDQMSQPSRNGAVTVTEFCTCGRVIGMFETSIL